MKRILFSLAVIIAAVAAQAKTLIALGTWSWGSGMAGGDQVFGNHTNAENLKSVFEVAYNAGLTMWENPMA
ncbi:MAG: hypothetical protein K2N35_14210 [Muribaculaceae bacterium]|nr:hypothetical protein [Muribaculaceae bacterium]